MKLAKAILISVPLLLVLAVTTFLTALSQASPDPAISNLSVLPLAGAAHIRWSTSSMATQRVFYDTVSHPSDTDGTQYASSTSNDTLADSSHQFRLIEYLTPNTTYFFKARSANNEGVTFTAEDSFTTAADGARLSRLLIIRVNFPDDLASLPSNDAIDAHMFNVALALDTQSFGKSKLVWTILPGTLTAPHTTGFYKELEAVSNLRRAEELAIDVSGLAFSSGFDTNDYFQYVIWIPQLYNWSNGGFFTGVNGTSQMHVDIVSADYLIWANLVVSGLGATGRANAWITNDSTVFGSAGAPAAIGFADPFEALGTSENQATPLNIKHKSGAGWLLPQHFLAVTTNGTYRIYAHDTTVILDESRKYGIRMSGYQGKQYWIEFRENDPPESVIVNWGGLMFLDMNPGEPLADGALTVGRTFTDPDGRSITFNGTGGGTPRYAELAISVLEPDLSPQPTPTATPSPIATPTVTPTPSPNPCALLPKGKCRKGIIKIPRARLAERNLS